MFKRILVPLDGSSEASEALPVAARIARASGGSISLLEVASPQLDYGGGSSIAPMMTGEVNESDLATAADYLRQVEASEVLAGISTVTEVSFGLPAQCIVSAANSGEVDLVVLHSHGRTGFTRWALGSVAHTLVHESTIPTLVLREIKIAPLSLSGETPRPVCALIPLDGSELAEAALAPAASLVAALAAPAQGVLHLAQVVRPSQTSADEGYINKGNEEALEQAETYLAQVIERLQATDQKSRLSIISSVKTEKDVASALVDLAEHGDGEMGASDLIAISTHGRHGLERWVMGSVTDRVLNTTRLPMLIVRPPR
jgi:nucleotide-binding universal stress UspA family protein